MKIGFAEEYTSNIELDQELKLNSKTGIVLNSGVHPYITVDNLLHFLPFNEIDFKDYIEGTVYNKYSEIQDRKDIVKYNDSLYQCLKNEVLNIAPGSDSSIWMLTSKENIILKSWIEKVRDKVVSDLYLSRRLINSQYIYENGESKYNLPNDYSGWVFEAKGSDYVTITLNEISLQALTNSPVNLYVVNEGQLIDTLVLNPKNGRVSFEELNYSFSGRGKWIFAIESQEVMTNFGWVDELKYDGFVCYPVTGIGNTPESSRYTYQNVSNGLGFNVSVTLESENYLNYNLQNFVGLFKATFEYMTLQMFLANSHQRSNRTENGINKDMLMMETKDLEANTSAKRYFYELREAKKIIQKTFDTQLGNEDSGFEVEVTSV